MITSLNLSVPIQELREKIKNECLINVLTFGYSSDIVSVEDFNILVNLLLTVPNPNPSSLFFEDFKLFQDICVFIKGGGEFYLREMKVEPEIITISNDNNVPLMLVYKNKKYGISIYSMITL